MKKLFTIACLLLFFGTTFAQQFSISNLSRRRITVTVYAYGTTAGSCSSLIHSTTTVNAGFLDAYFGFSGTWYDASNNPVSTAAYGNPVWVRADYSYTCGLSPASDYLQNALCGTAKYTGSSACSVTGLWTNFPGGDVVVSLDD